MHEVAAWTTYDDIKYDKSKKVNCFLFNPSLTLNWIQLNLTLLVYTKSYLSAMQNSLNKLES